MDLDVDAAGPGEMDVDVEAASPGEIPFDIEAALMQLQAEGLIEIDCFDDTGNPGEEPAGTTGSDIEDHAASSSANPAAAISVRSSAAPLPSQARRRSHRVCGLRLEVTNCPVP